MWGQAGLLDVDRLASNDVHAMLTTYGVEAARATILKEARSRLGLGGLGLLPARLATSVSLAFA